MFTSYGLPGLVGSLQKLLEVLGAAPVGMLTRSKNKRRLSHGNRRMKMFAMHDVAKDAFFAVLRSGGIEEVLMSSNRNRRMKMVATSDVEKDAFFAVLRSYGIEEVLMTSFRFDA